MKKFLQKGSTYFNKLQTQNKLLTWEILLAKPVEPVERWVAALKKPFDFKFLCKRHSNAEAFDNQYGKVMFSSPAWVITDKFEN